MTHKALISDLTWRSLDMQREAFRGYPVFVAPDDIPHLFRPTQRKTPDIIHVISLGVIANNEKGIRSFLELGKKRECQIWETETEDIWVLRKGTNIKPIIAAWRSARKKGAAKIGGCISAEKRKQESSAGAAKIKGRWGLPSREHPTSVLLREAGISYNTAISILGRRPIVQANYQAALKRKERRNAKAN